LLKDFEFADFRDHPLVPRKTALIIQGCQNDILGEGAALTELGMHAHARKQNLKANLVQLAKVFRAIAAPVVHVWTVADTGSLPPTNSPGWDAVNQSAEAGLAAGARRAFMRGTWGAHPVASLEAMAGDFVIEKTRGSAFSSGLDSLLRSLGIENIVSTGTMTNYSVIMTCFEGHDLGYRCYTAADGACSRNDMWHEAAIRYEMPWLGWTFASCRDVEKALQMGACFQ